MTFEELGVVLRTEREKKNINIIDVANQLKINSRYLRALEEGDVASLPHPAYIRGFIRSYAQFLGLSADEVQEILDEVNDLNKEKPKKQLKASKPKAVEEARSSHTGLIVFVILCLLGAGLYYAWNEGYLDFIKEWQESGKQQTSELQSAESFIAAKDAEKAKREAQVIPSPPKEENRNENILPLPGNQPIPVVPEPEPVLPKVQREVEEIPLPVIAAVPTITEESEAATDSQEVNASGQHKLIITAIEECWIHSNADKTDTRQFSLRKGDTFALTFADSLELKLGNAGGVRLRYDGSDLPPPGTSGQVRTLIFPPKSNS